MNDRELSVAYAIGEAFGWAVGLTVVLAAVVLMARFAVPRLAAELRTGGSTL